MSTTTSTMTSTSSTPGTMPLNSYPSVLPPDVTSSLNTVSDTIAPTLRSLYPRAARALLQKDMALTHSLISSAFSILHAPQALIPDTLDSHRRKWDILRITLETTVFVSPPKSTDPEALPVPLRSNLMMSGQSLVATMHTRSVRFFTPTLTGQKPKAAYLPAQILVTLALSSLKLECPDVARGMIEDWLAQREAVDYIRNDAEGYEKVLDLFCLHVLPRLHDWEYARDFLEYERALAPKSRQRLQATVSNLRKQEIEAARSIPTPPPHSSEASTPNIPSPARTPSPAPSTSSNSSVDTNDTHSTRTVVPRTPRPKPGLNGFTPLTPTTISPSASSLSISGHPVANGHATHGPSSSSSSASTSRGNGHANAPGAASNSVARSGRRVSHSRSPSRVITARSPDMFSLVKAYLRANLTTSRIVFAVLFVLMPLFSFVLRLRRKRLRLQGPATPRSIASARSSIGGRGSVDEVRRRLGVSEGGGNVLSAAWRELSRAVVDAVRMAGGGLV